MSGRRHWKGRKGPSFYKAAVKVLRHGFEDPETGRRMGKFAKGFEASEGFDLRKIEDWTPAQKRKVTKMFALIDELTARPFTVYRARDTKRLEQVQKAAQHPYIDKNLKVAFIPVNRKQPVKVRINKKGQVTFKQGNVARIPINFSDYGITPADLALDTKQAVKKIVKAVPAKRYRVQAGEFECNEMYSAGIIGSAFVGDELPEVIEKLVNKYSSENGYDPEDSNSSWYGNWLFGVIGYQYESLTDYKALRAAYGREKRDLADRRKALRLRAKRLKEKELKLKRKKAAKKAAKTRWGK